MEVRSITRSRRFYFHPTAAHRGPPIGERETHAAKTNKMEQEQVEYKVITLLLLLETDKSYAQNPTYAKSGNRRQSCFVSKRYGPASIDRSIFPYITKKLLSGLISKIVFKKFRPARMRLPFQTPYTHRASASGMNGTTASITRILIRCYLQNFLLPGSLHHLAAPLKKSIERCSSTGSKPLPVLNFRNRFVF